jgi:putative tryptophan/tyrosine transport system substrate-binding protein
VAEDVRQVLVARLADLAAKYRLPAIYSERLFVEAGGLMSYGANDRGIHRRAAVFVEKILKGAKPSELPVEQPNTYELVINLKTAKALGLTIPPFVTQCPLITSWSDRLRLGGGGANP